MNNARSLGLSLRRKYNYKQQIYGYHLANPWVRFNGKSEMEHNDLVQRKISK